MKEMRSYLVAGGWDRLNHTVFHLTRSWVWFFVASICLGIALSSLIVGLEGYWAREAFETVSGLFLGSILSWWGFRAMLRCESHYRMAGEYSSATYEGEGNSGDGSA